MRFSRLIAGFTLTVAVACSDGPTNPVAGASITLSATQAATLVGRMETFGSLDPTLASLADTVDVVLKGGAEARRIDVTTDLGATSYYAVSLHRASPNGASSSATFHVIAFDDPSAPTRFIILGGWATGNTTPNTVSGPIGAGLTTSLTAHLFSVSGNQVSRWHASTGTVSFTALEMLEICSGSAGASCVRGTMDATFDITGTVPGNGTSGQRTASGTMTAIPGIRLSP